jgi:hypothetical protein
VSAYGTRTPNTSRESITYTEDGAVHTRTVIRTPRGELSSVMVAAPQTAQTERTSWRKEMLFKGPDDYAALEFMIRDAVYVPSDEAFARAQKRVGGDAYFKTSAPGAPIHNIMYEYMGLETFSIEWAERRDEIVKLSDALSEKHREICAIVAKSPVLPVQLGGNYAPEVLGKPRFVDFVLPHWEEACGILHEGGKLAGCHLDANNMLWAAEVGASGLDWIESFTPAPDTDMTVADARRLWPGKVLFVNFPSSVHLAPAAVIEETTKQMLREAAPGDRFIIGIAESVPDHRWRESFSTILRTVNEYGRLPIGR